MRLQLPPALNRGFGRDGSRPLRTRPGPVASTSALPTQNSLRLFRWSVCCLDSSSFTRLPFRFASPAFCAVFQRTWRAGSEGLDKRSEQRTPSEPARWILQSLAKTALLVIFICRCLAAAFNPVLNTRNAGSNFTSLHSSIGIVIL